MPSESKEPSGTEGDSLGALLPEQPTRHDQVIQELQEALTEERDARKEDRFVFIVAVVILLDIVFFTVMPSFGGPLALLILQLLVLIPLARRMGMEEVAQLISRVIGRMAGKVGNDE